MVQKFMRLREVLNAVGLSKSTVYDLIKHKRFPDRVYIANHSVAWLENEISAWQEAKRKGCEWRAPPKADESDSQRA